MDNNNVIINPVPSLTELQDYVIEFRLRHRDCTQGEVRHYILSLLDSTDLMERPYWFRNEYLRGILYLLRRTQ